MAFDDQINKNQGSIKASEVFLDRALEIIKNSIGETGLKTLELMMKPVSDSIRRNNFILHSKGQIRWTGTEIQFDGDAKANDIVLKLMLMDEGAPRTVDIYLEGTTGANAAALFNSIPLNDQELVYLEIDRDLLLNAVSPSPGVEPARLIIGNNVSSTSITTGARLQKVSLSDTTGMPEMLATESGASKSQTMNIPLAARLDWTDGIDNYQDVWWIPHGIRWPANTLSAVGAAIVKGFETLPSLYVRTQTELQNAIAELTITGGIILVQENISIDTTITIPEGISLIGRTSMNFSLSVADPSLTFVSGGKLVLDNRAKLWNLNLIGSSNFGTSFDEWIVEASGNWTEIRDCSFQLTNASGGKAICVRFTGAANRIWNTHFKLGTTVAYRVGIQYVSGTGNIDTDSIFTS